MNKAKFAVEAGKAVLKGWRAWIEPVRVWLTKRAWKKEVEANMKKTSMVLIPLLLVGCGTINKGLIAYDNTVHNGALNPYLNQVPEGYEARPYVQNAAGTRVDITGWEVRWEIIPSARFLPTLLPDAIAKQRAQPSPLAPVVSLIQANGPLVMNQPEQSGAGDAAALLQAEAAKDGVK